MRQFDFFSYLVSFIKIVQRMLTNMLYKHLFLLLKQKVF